MTGQLLEKKNKSGGWKFILYISGNAPVTRETESRLRKLCDHYLPNGYHLDIIDVTENTNEIPPDVLAVPMVARVSPLPERRVIGDLSDTKRTVQGLGLKEAVFSSLLSSSPQDVQAGEPREAEPRGEKKDEG